MFLLPLLALCNKSVYFLILLLASLFVCLSSVLYCLFMFAAVKHALYALATSSTSEANLFHVSIGSSGRNSLTSGCIRSILQQLAENFHFISSSHCNLDLSPQKRNFFNNVMVRGEVDVSSGSSSNLAEHMYRCPSWAMSSRVVGHSGLFLLPWATWLPHNLASESALLNRSILIHCYVFCQHQDYFSP